MKKLIVFLLLAVFSSQFVYAGWGDDLFKGIVEGVIEELEEEINEDSGVTIKYINMQTGKEISKDQTGGLYYNKLTYDKDGNLIAFTSYDDKGNIYNFKLTGNVMYTYDKNGNRTSATYYDENNKPSVDGFDVHRYEWTYDKSCNLTSEKCFDIYGNETEKKEWIGVRD